MIASFDRTHGVLYAIRGQSDPLHTNFIGNPQNVRRARPEDSHAMGDLMTTVWALNNPERLASNLLGTTSQTSGAWRQELTGRSSDIRKVSSGGSSFQVEYTGQSKNEGGIRSYDLKMRYTFASDGFSAQRRLRRLRQQEQRRSANHRR